LFGSRHGLAQKIDAFLVQTTHAVEVGEVDERGREVLIEPQGRPILVLRLSQHPTLHHSGKDGAWSGEPAHYVAPAHEWVD
jgi:hypothetical protein